MGPGFKSLKIDYFNMSELFDTKKDYTIEDDCVLLRPLLAEDTEILQVFSVNEPEIWTYSSVKVAVIDNLKRYITDTLQARTQGMEYPFIIFDKRTNEYAGSTRFYDIQPFHKTMQLGYTWYGKKFQGTGLNKHCKYLLLKFAFDRMGMERVEFRADINNSRSIAAMKSIGCTVEGVLRKSSIKPDGSRRDSIILSILREEWENGVKEMLAKKVAGT